MSNKNYSFNEIEKFNQDEKDWWNQEGAFKTLHHMNSTRMDFIIQHTDIRHKKILDIGCGGGIFSESLAKNGADVLGIDLAGHAISQAESHKTTLSQEIQSRLNYQIISSEELSRNYQSHFEIICCMELLEHVPDPKALLQDCASLLKPQGKLFLATINRNATSFLYAIAAAEYVLGLLPKGTHQYKNFIKPSELKATLSETGFSLQDISGLSYDPFTKETHLRQDASINYLMYAELLRNLER